MDGGQLIIGAHMSIAGGFHRAVERGQKIGCSALQIFLKNSNRWQGKPVTQEDRDRFLRAREVAGLSHVMAHSSYLINDRRFAAVPKILETPKGPDLSHDVMNLRVLRSLEARR